MPMYEFESYYQSRIKLFPDQVATEATSLHKHADVSDGQNMQLKACQRHF